MAAPAEHTVGTLGSEECVPAGSESEGCDANGGNQGCSPDAHHIAEAATQAAAPEAVMWAVASVTGTRAAARGAATRVEAAWRSRILSKVYESWRPLGP